VTHSENADAVRSRLDPLPFIRVVRQDTELHIVGAMRQGNGLRDGLQESRFACARIAGDKHGARMWIIEIEQYR
jgi:hypothetical protein